MSLIVNVCKIVIFFYVFYSLCKISMGTGRKGVKWLYVLACIVEIIMVGSSGSLYEGMPAVQWNLFLFLLLLLVIPEIQKNNFRYYIVYIFIILYNLYYYFGFLIGYEEYKMQYRFLIEVIRYLTEFTCIFLVSRLVDNNRNTVETVKGLKAL